MKEHMIVSLLTGICIIMVGFVVVISNKETPKAPDEKKSTPDLKYARFDISDSSVEPAPEDRIIKKWKLSEKIQKEIKMNYNTSEKGEIIIKKKGVYIIYSQPSPSKVFYPKYVLMNSPHHRDRYLFGEDANITVMN